MKIRLHREKKTNSTVRQSCGFTKALKGKHQMNYAKKAVADTATKLLSFIQIAYYTLSQPANTGISHLQKLSFLQQPSCCLSVTKIIEGQLRT